MHIKIQKKTQKIFMNNLIINPQFIGSQQTQRKKGLHKIDLQEHRGEHSLLQDATNATLQSETLR